MTTHEQPHLDERVVIVGGGQAGAECAAYLRMGGHRGSVTVLSDEPTYPYARPPLSKAYLSGTASVEDLLIRPPATYRHQGLDVVLDARVTEVDRAARAVRMESGSSVSYDRLVLATGGRARLLPIPEVAAATNVHTLRTLADIDGMRGQFRPAARMVIIGGGYVGLEVAAVARTSGLHVTIVEAADRVLSRVTAPVVSAFFERLHLSHGVEVRTGRSVSAREYGDDGRLTCISLDNGDRLPMDLAVVGIGLVPNTELAERAGLPVDDGVIVDEFCRTIDPRVFAIGDCTRHPCYQHGGLRRLESAPNATEQARVAASVLTGEPRAYDAVPWFWSDQYDVKLQTIGLSANHDEIVARGIPEHGHSFAVFYLKHGVVIAADVINSPRDFTIAKKLVATRAHVSGSRLSDPATALKDCVVEEVRAPASR
jgi:3-phenylpropionate/trans-cinnamate dioxygenase ferredoxin reductase subunit